MALFDKYIFDKYNEYFIKNGDDRVKEWPLMKDPFGIFCVVATYLYVIYNYLPKHMKNRKPYNLTFIIQIYNIVQVISCIYVVYGYLANGWLSHYKLLCQPVDYSDNPKEIRMLEISYFYLLLKLLEFVETCFFSLRNKTSQITFLHIYHHISTLGFAWVTTKYFGGGILLSIQLLNSIVHIVMYTYYFLAAIGPSMQKRLTCVKSKITTMQLVQFVMMSSSTLICTSECRSLLTMIIVFNINMLILITLFYNFYRKSYSSKLVKSE